MLTAWPRAHHLGGALAWKGQQTPCRPAQTGTISSLVIRRQRHLLLQKQVAKGYRFGDSGSERIYAAGWRSLASPRTRHEDYFDYFTKRRLPLVRIGLAPVPLRFAALWPPFPADISGEEDQGTTKGEGPRPCKGIEPFSPPTPSVMESQAPLFPRQPNHKQEQGFTPSAARTWVACVSPSFPVRRRGFAVNLACCVCRCVAGCKPSPPVFEPRSWRRLWTQIPDSDRLLLVNTS